MKAEMAARYYVDTSAYLCILLGEQGSRALTREIGSGHCLSSVLLALEAKRNLVRMSRQGMLDASALTDALARLEQDVEVFALRDLTLDLCTDVRVPMVSTPRSLDLVHLRTALWFHEREPIRRFLTLDDGQRVAARELALPA
jgi:hypothetical protein